MLPAVAVWRLLFPHPIAQRHGPDPPAFWQRRINEKVPSDFWESTKEKLRAHFKKNEFTEGLCEGIEEAGQQLKKFFPYQADDTNELPDDVSFG